MNTFIALLRGINVGGNKRIKMADLRDLLNGIDLPSKTLLASGNVVFKTERSDIDSLRADIEQAIADHFGFEVIVMVLTAEDFISRTEAHPYSEQALTEPKKISVVFLSEAPTDEAVASLPDAHRGPETIQVDGQTLYCFYPDGKGRSKLDNAFIERFLNVHATARNWNTVEKIAALAKEF